MTIDKRDFTHYGWIFGIVPIYVNMNNPTSPEISERHWSITPVLNIMETLFISFNDMVSNFNIEHRASFAIRLTGEIK